MLFSKLNTTSLPPKQFGSSYSLWLLRSELTPFWVQFLLRLPREALLPTIQLILSQAGPGQDAPCEARTPDLEVNSLTL